MSNALVPLQDLERMAIAFAKSALFGAKTPEQAMALLLLAQAEGLHPAIAMRDFDIIQGRPAKKAEAMLRTFIGSGGSVEWHEMTDEKADATFSHPHGGKVRIDWDMARARKAGVAGKDMYNKYPRQMLANRVISEGCRRVYPASTSGLYVPEEISQIAREKDITPTAGAMQALTIDRQEVIMETGAQVRQLLGEDKAMDAYALIENSGFDNEEKIALWTQFDCKQRGVLKRMKEAEKASEAGTISPAQHKRLEARIKELGLDRDEVKADCVAKWGVAHFTELNKEQYAELDASLAASLEPKATPQPPSRAAPPSASAAAVAPTLKDTLAAIDAMKGQKSAAACIDMLAELDEAERLIAQEAYDFRVAELKAAGKPKQTKEAAHNAVLAIQDDQL